MHTAADTKLTENGCCRRRSQFQQWTEGGGGVPVVDTVSGGQTAWVREEKNGRGGEMDGRKKAKQKGSCHVGTESLIDDVQCGAKAAVQVEKASLCDADDNAINPALSQPMGSAPRDI